MEAADGEVVAKSCVAEFDDEEEGLLIGMGCEGERDRTAEEDRVAGTVYEQRVADEGPDYDPDFEDDEVDE
jgi:hypothetical protein